MMVDKQRELAKNKQSIMEGRDTGSVVMPSAQLKFYLDATVDERAMRRVRALEAQGKPANFEEIRAQLIIRDEADMNRPDSPLGIPHGAIVIDSTHLTIQEVIEQIETEMRKRCLLPSS